MHARSELSRAEIPGGEEGETSGAGPLVSSSNRAAAIACRITARRSGSSGSVMAGAVCPVTSGPGTPGVSAGCQRDHPRSHETNRPWPGKKPRLQAENSDHPRPHEIRGRNYETEGHRFESCLARFENPLREGFSSFWGGLVGPCGCQGASEGSTEPLDPEPIQRAPPSLGDGPAVQAPTCTGRAGQDFGVPTCGHATRPLS